MLKKQTSLFSSVTRAITLAVVLSILSACVSSGSKNGASDRSRPVTDKAQIHAQLARGYLQQKQYSVAKSSLDTALSINPDHSESNYVMGLLMLELKQYEDAERYLRKAVSSDRQNSAAAHDFGMFLCQVGKEKEAVENFEIAAINPFFDKPELSFMRAGECLAKINDLGAEAYLKKSLSINPKLRPALYRLAVIKLENQSYLSARAYIERYFAITKPQPATLLLAYKIESSLNARDMADKYRVALLEGFPGSDEARSLRRQVRQ